MIHALSCHDHANLTDILRVLNERYQKLLNYKPCHNQIKKPELTNVLQSLTEQATKELLIQPFQSSLPAKYPFKHIHLHDSSLLTMHEKLKDAYQGRFTKTAPAAIEMHLTLDLAAGTANYVGLDTDKESEKHHRPFADELKDTLVLMNTGYF